MNANALAKNYSKLTPEERFRLILAASQRDDEAERHRLTHAGQRLILAMPDHAPFSHSFAELSHQVLLELLEGAALYHDAFSLSDDCSRDCSDEEAAPERVAEEGDAENRDRAEQKPDVNADAEPEEDDPAGRPTWQRILDTALGTGFILRTKMDGWKLFCQRRGFPPLLMWKKLPGFTRLQHALALTENAAFTRQGMVRFMNRIRPAGKPKLTEAQLITAETYADGCEAAYLHQVEWWSG